MYTNQVRLINPSCLYETTLKVEPIDRVYLPIMPSQHALFVREKLLELSILTVYTNQVRLVNLCCLYETTLKVEPIVCVYLRNSPSQPELFARDTN